VDLGHGAAQERPSASLAADLGHGGKKGHCAGVDADTGSNSGLVYAGISQQYKLSALSLLLAVVQFIDLQCLI
jgi:hypothetical protein